MTTDCFVTTNFQRPYFLEVTLCALKAAGFEPILVHKPMLERYYECERLAKTELYILIDDDIIPNSSDTLHKLIALAEKNPQYSQIGLGWKANMQDEANSTWITSKSEDIWDFDHCGGCVCLRKGTIKDLGYEAEYESGYGDDRVMGSIARVSGYKVGVAHKLWFHHLGIQDTTFKLK